MHSETKLDLRSFSFKSYTFQIYELSDTFEKISINFKSFEVGIFFPCSGAESMVVFLSAAAGYIFSEKHINVKKMVLFSFALSAAIGAIAGIVITPISLMEYERGTMLALKGFAAAVLGGLGSGIGAVVAGFLIGIVESLGAGLISSGYKDAIALVILLIVLFIKPSGLFGTPEIE